MLQYGIAEAHVSQCFDECLACDVCDALIRVVWTYNCHMLQFMVILGGEEVRTHANSIHEMYKYATALKHIMDMGLSYVSKYFF
jgi:hypothetical protein